MSIGRLKQLLIIGVQKRNSLDGSGFQIKSYVHYGVMENNAWWVGGNTNVMIFGDGDGNLLNPFTSLDIVAHEMGHGINHFTANMTPGNAESGALNEGFSDIWAACVKAWAAPNKTRWISGGEIMNTTLFNCIRNMQNPRTPLSIEGLHPSRYQGTFWDFYDEPHTNSTVLGHWFYLLCEGGSDINDGIAYDVSGIGIEKAELIAYRALTNHLFSSANYNAARNAMIDAAIYLYSNDSQEVISVMNAWHAVGVGNRYPPVISGPGSVCTTGSFSFITPPGTTSIVWSGDAKLSLSGGQGTSSATFSKAANGISTIKAVITAGGNVTTITKTVSVGVPDRPWIVKGTSIDTFSILTYSMCLGQGTTNLYLTIKDPDNSAGSNSYTVTKTLYPENFTVLLNGCYLTVNPSHTGPGQFTVKANNGCGSSALLTVNLSINTCNFGGKIPIDPPGWPTNIIMYPNPASTEVTIELDNYTDGHRGDVGDETYTITVLDLYGNTVYTGQKQGRQFNLSTASLSNGIYYVIISDGQNTARKKLIVKH